MTIGELRTSILVTGPSDGDANWDMVWRAHLVDQLSVLCGHLREVGITDVYADGSFATDKLKPGDIDGYFVCDYEPFVRDQLPRLIARDEAWDFTQRRPDRHGKMKQLMWHRYRVELFPQFLPPFEALTSPASDQQGLPIQFSHFFRHTRSGQPRGIVNITAKDKA